MGVFLDYSQSELDSQYNQGSLVPDPGPYIDQWKELTRLAKAAGVCWENISYGETEDEVLDLYQPDPKPKYNEGYPLLIFCHGGAWRSLSKDESGFFSLNFVSNRIAVAALNFSLAPASNLKQIVEQVRQSILYLFENSSELNLNAERFHVMGHSSGAHLAANIAVTDWSQSAAPPDLIKGLVAVSGPYNLEPVRLSARNNYLNLSKTDAFNLSPGLHLRDELPPAVVAWGGKELDEFQRQGSEFAEVWSGSGADVTRIFYPKNNHFEMGSEISNPQGKLFKATLEQILVV